MTLGRFERSVVATAAVAIASIGVWALAAGASVAWVLLGVTGVVSAATLVIQLQQRRLFEPLTVIAAVMLLSVTARALQLFLNADELLSFQFEPNSVDSLLNMENQEIALFVTRDLKEPLDSALTRAVAATSIFTCLVVVGYLLPFGRQWATRLARVGRGTASEFQVKPLVIACMAIAVIGQIAILIKVGGPVEAANHMLDQEVLGTGLAYQVLLGFGTAALLIWAAWDPPRSAGARTLFVLMAVEVCGFYALAGTRTRVLLTLLMLTVVIHYIVRPFRLREMLAGVALVVVFASALLGVRQATEDEPIGSALGSAPKYLLDPRGVLNDLTEFDGVFTATTVIGSPHRYHEPAPFQYGKGILAAFHSYVPARFDSGKPDSGDVEFRKLVWGDELQAGRPYTVIGDFWNDFGFPGVAVGALLFGLFARALVGLVSPGAEGAGREYRVVLYAIALVVLYTEVVNTYSVAIGFVLTLAVPFLVAMHLLRPIADRAGRRVGPAPRESETPA